MEDENIKILQNNFLENAYKLTKNIKYSKNTDQNWTEIKFTIPKPEIRYYYNLAHRGLFNTFLVKLQNILLNFIYNQKIEDARNKSELSNLIDLNKPEIVCDTILINSNLYTKLLIENKIQKYYYFKELETLFEISDLNIIPVFDKFSNDTNQTILIDSSKIAITFYGKEKLELDIRNENNTIKISIKFKLENYDIDYYTIPKYINSIIKINLIE